MAKTYNNAIQLQQGFKFTEPVASDDRQYVETASDLLTIQGLIPNLPIHIEDEDIWVEWNGQDQSIANNFTERLKPLKDDIVALQNTTNSLVSGIGYAIPQSGNTPSNEPVPTLNGIYRAEAGTYTNWGGIVVPNTQGFIYDIQVSNVNTTPVFTLQSTDLNITFDSTPTESSTNAVESGGIYKYNNQLKVFNNDATPPDSIINAFLDLRLYGITDKTKFYCIAIVRKNETSNNNWGIDIYEAIGTGFGNSVCEFNVSGGYTPSANIEKIQLIEKNSSGITGEIVVKWDEIPDTTSLSGMNFPLTGIKYEAYIDDASISLNSKDVVDGGDVYNNLVLINGVNDLTESNKTSIKLVNKANQATGVETIVLQPSENTWWNVNNTFDYRYHAVRFIMTQTTVQNKIELPFRKNYDLVDLVGDIVVKIGLNGVFIFEKTITNAELVTWGLNAQTVSTLAVDCMYPLEIPLIELKSTDDLYIGWGCVNAADKLTFQYDNNDATGTYYADRYIVNNNDDIAAITTVPTITSVGGWTFVVNFIYEDFIQKKINSSINPAKATIANVFPNKIYTVCNDVDKTDSGFNSINFSAMLYADHFLKLTESKEINWDKTGSDRLPIFSPIAEDNSSYNNGVDVLTTAFSEKLVGDTINDINVSFDHISTKSSLGENDFPKILYITDSTGQFLAERPIEDTNWQLTFFSAYVRDLFYKDYLANGESGHNALCMGVDDQTLWTVTGAGNPLRAGVESKGGWTTRDFLYSKDFANDNNRFYDSAKAGTVKFSVSKYLERYKTLADDGTTRLVQGTTAGTEVTDVNSYDLCTPTHIVIQTAFNDLEANWSSDIDLMIAEIKAEYPNMIVIISTIDAAGSYFPNKYPMFEKNDINMLNDTLHTKMYNLLNSAKAKEDTANKIFYAPNYFIQPTAWSVASRGVNPPEFIANEKFIFRAKMGSGNNFHPNTYAHANWGYQLYSLIKYTLTL